MRLRGTVLLSKGAIEAAVCKNDNIASFEGEYVGVQHFFGQGAGKFPTAYAVVEDLRDLLRTRASRTCAPGNRP